MMENVSLSLGKDYLSGASSRMKLKRYSERASGRDEDRSSHFQQFGENRSSMAFWSFQGTGRMGGVGYIYRLRPGGGDFFWQLSARRFDDWRNRLRDPYRSSAHTVSISLSPFLFPREENLWKYRLTSWLLFYFPPSLPLKLHFSLSRSLSIISTEFLM